MNSEEIDIDNIDNEIDIFLDMAFLTLYWTFKNNLLHMKDDDILQFKTNMYDELISHNYHQIFVKKIVDSLIAILNISKNNGLQFEDMLCEIEHIKKIAKEIEYSDESNDVQIITI